MRLSVIVALLAFLAACAAVSACASSDNMLPGGDAGSLDGAGGRADHTSSLDAATDGGPDTGGLDTGTDGGPGGLDAGTDSGRDAGGLDGGDITVGLVAFYPFDETSGTMSADTSGNGHTATMQGATFTAGLQGNAATMDGTTQYVSLPGGIVSGLSSFSISAWVYLNTATFHFRIFDFGTGTTNYMFLTASDQNPPNARFAITTSAIAGEQKVAGPPLAVGSWQHIVVSLTGTVPGAPDGGPPDGGPPDGGAPDGGAPDGGPPDGGDGGSQGTNVAILYVNGVQVGQNPNMTLNPASLGTTTQNWIGRSQFAADPYLNGQIDNFRIYNRPLSAAEVQYIFQQQL